MADEPTELPLRRGEGPRTTADVDAGWGALLDGIGHSGPLVVATEPATTLPELALPVDDPEPPIEAPRAKVDEPLVARGDSERTAVRRHIGEDAPLMTELGVEPPQRIEESAEAPRALEIAAAVPRPIEGGDESWPRRPPVEIVARASGSHRVVTVPTAAPTRRASAANVERPTARPTWQWSAGAAAIVAVLVWLTIRPSDETPAADSTALAASTSTTPRVDEKPDAPAVKKAAAVVDPPRAEVKAPASPPIEAKAPAPTAPPAPASTAPPAPTPTPAPAPTPTIEGTPANLLAAATTALGERRYADAHALADRAWDGERTNEAVRVMALAACEMPDGALARDAFRKLEGPDVRKEAYLACQRSGVDLRAKVDGYTPKELLAMARREAAAGNHEKAYEHAKASNRLGKSADALQLMAESACHNKDTDAVAYLMGMLPRDRKRAVESVCTTAGTPLPE